MEQEGKNKFLKNGISITVFNNSGNSFCAKKKKLPRDKIDVQYYSALMSTFTYSFLKFISKNNCK